MMSLRTISVALALALAGCAPSSGPYSPGQNYSTGWGQPVTSGYGGWGSGYGYGGNASYGQSALFRPAKGITCDRAREVCYDRYGLSYYATQKYFSERDANQSVRKYGEQVFLFAPKRGVSCDRRTRTCSDAGGLDAGWTDDVFGDKSERVVNTWLGGDSFVPERYVTCVNATKVCSDRNGPSVNLTQVYYGRAAAQDLADQLGQNATVAPVAAPAIQPTPAAPAPQVSPLTEALQDSPEALPVVEAPLPAEGAAPGYAQPVMGASAIEQPVVSAPEAPQSEFVPQPIEQPVVQMEPAAPDVMPEPQPAFEPAPAYTPEPKPEFQPEPQPEPMQQAEPQPEPAPAPVADGGGAAACADPAGCAQ